MANVSDHMPDSTESVVKPLIVNRYFHHQGFHCHGKWRSVQRRQLLCHGMARQASLDMPELPQEPQGTSDQHPSAVRELPRGINEQHQSFLTHSSAVRLTSTIPLFGIGFVHSLTEYASVRK